MPKHSVPVIFVDSNVLIDALLVRFAAAKTIVTLASYKKLKLLTCAQVIEDVEAEIVDKIVVPPLQREILDCWQEMLKRTRIKIISDPSEEAVQVVSQDYLALMRHLADIPILTAALNHHPKPDFILSGNREHFNDEVSNQCGIPIRSCSEFIRQYLLLTLWED
jgi:predicted nucleic acid-binding protein